MKDIDKIIAEHVNKETIWVGGACNQKDAMELSKECKRLRAELAAAQKRIAELEGRTCEKCKYNERCDRKIHWNFSNMPMAIKLGECSEWDEME